MLSEAYSNQALKFLKGESKDAIKRILKKIDDLKADPLPKDCIKIHGFKEKLYRVRVGDYRILYEMDLESQRLGIVKIDKRSRVYQ